MPDSSRYLINAAVDSTDIFKLQNNENFQGENDLRILE